MTEQSTMTVRRAVPAGPLGVRLCINQRPASSPDFRLLEGSCVCGAAPDVDLVIQDRTVSRRHAEITLVPEGVRVRDLSSHNGTWYGGQRVNDCVLAAGSTIHLGQAELRIEPDRDALERSPEVELDHYGELLGSSKPMQKLYGLLQRIEPSLANVVIEGESGTGKELVARAIHRHSAVASGPFVALNCAALDPSLVRSELFGHKRGAFTGALESREGAFEAASGGTLFLDELAELPAEVQPLLLRALETREVTRLGENTPRPVSVRVIVASNRNLASQVSAGLLREDLYYRLVVVRLVLPALGERGADRRLLAAHFARQFGIGQLPAEIEEELEARAWPGNVRELKNVIETYAVLGTLPASEPARDPALDEWLRKFVDLGLPYADQKDRLLKSFLRVYLEELLSHTAGNKSLAARISGLERAYLNKLAIQLCRAPDIDGTGRS
jgi:two-component system response regulator GlrR